ncbi:MAG: hypothetical protein ALECFALPRED_008678 [Alectoria fallacina]|uniref:Uncharacterized protein n=1 Tax=Alectoria fallacina TaxID=1903189 RepID=A0A8H3J4B9_9LECA|nr:MAG: hypothetical protein ALECFALPRED_008678 [Alectoria fallacina]
MARHKTRKVRSQKGFKDSVTVGGGDSTVLAGTSTAAAFDGSTMHPKSIKDLQGYIHTSSSNAQSTPIDATKPRADSISAMELNDMATKQLLAELESTIASPRRVRKSISSISTNSHESMLATGSQKISSSPVEAWSYSAGALILVVFLVSLILAWP